MWYSMLAIGLGAALGANLRWGLGLMLNALFPAIPPGTLIANWLGSWLIGMALACFMALPELPPALKLFVVTGFLGALTTFSTFSAEMWSLLQSGRYLTALAGIALHVVGALCMTGLGFATVKLIRWMMTGATG
ncbi:fluoride efflux transporter CrcB [Larsenimonas suaedae]|uniref:Fluoride-specific ion channel FluC n=1 Tax=Larsenimonas suaedae TaxID=1851019 RepID=A0ABU1GWZ0_9GAMM|nr:fluoride efflux transporter CrcB [Larsenimonas suaedae]MCM2973086.1 fluoride efflux transporter CrcB [Larsenimonas suaedae]MDR5896523.1 fluoride efflux transporter CrcB [Larsenimonas suaedae]